MRSIKFKQANDRSGRSYINHTKNTIIQRFKPSKWERIKILFGSRVWVGTSIDGQPRKINVDAKRTAFLKDED